MESLDKNAKEPGAVEKEQGAAVPEATNGTGSTDANEPTPEATSSAQSTDANMAAPEATNVLESTNTILPAMEATNTPASAEMPAPASTATTAAVESTTTNAPAPNNALMELTYLVQNEIQKVIVGQTNMVELLLAGLLADGHLLIEGVPGVAKTLTAKLLAKLIEANFSRIQFTPDLMPSDVIGTNVFNPQSASFQFKSGPIFSNLVLIDEINRAPAKTQAALFEVMEERQITVDGHTYHLDPPFMVIATQNPIEHEGTYRLPEAQLDRFMMKIMVTYPNLEEEIKILTKQNDHAVAETLQSIVSVITKDQLAAARRKIRQIHVEPKLIEFIARIIHETRNDRSLYLGASPRASVALLQVSKAIAVLRGRDFVIPEDVLHVVNPVLRHRISLTPEREMEGATADDVLKEIIGRIEIPR